MEKIVRSEMEALRAENRRLTDEVKRLVKAESALYEFQEKLDVQIQIYRKLYEVGKQFNATFRLDEILSLATRFVVYDLDFERCIVFMPSESGGDYRIRAYEGYYEEDEDALKARAPALSAADPIPVSLVDGLEYVMFSPEKGARGDRALRSLADGMLVDEFVAFPFGGDANRFAGFIVAGNTARRAEYHSRVRPDSDFILGLGNLTRQAGAAIDNARLVTDLKEMDRLKDEFLANTSHELRTPLNGIIGIAESLMDGVCGQPNPETMGNLAAISSSGRRLSSLVNDILDFSKLKRRGIRLRRRPLDLRSATQVVAAVIQPLAETGRLKIVNAIPPDFPPVDADEDRLQQILHNLIGNAIKFTESGTVEIGAREVPPPGDGQSEDAAQSEGDPDFAAVTVSDTGIGIPAEKLERIFESFEQADGSTSRRFGGTGLGLTITRQLVELHGGTIRVESTPGEGSTFVFTVPLAQAPAEEAASGDSAVAGPVVDLPLPDRFVPPEKAPERGGRGRRILIVDDEPVNRRALANRLSLSGYAVVQASSGREALDAIRDGGRPDLVLLDVMMPQMTGFEVLREIRRKWALNELPVVLLTARNLVTDLVAGLKAGANDFLAKPVSKDELLARVETHIRIRELTVENLRMAAELEIARRLQQMILPGKEELARFRELDIDGFMAPADEVGGDYFDVLERGDSVLLAAGDVTGHGLESGLLMVMAQSAIRALCECRKIDPVSFHEILNRVIVGNARRIDSDKSLFFATLDYSDGMITVSGQHEEIVVFRKHGGIERIDTSDLGFPLGLVADISDFVSSSNFRLEPGDGFVIYSDGVTEAENEAGDQYGIERLCRAAGRSREKTAAEINRDLMDDVRRHAGRQIVYDDMTLLTVKKR